MYITNSLEGCILFNSSSKVDTIGNDIVEFKIKYEGYLKVLESMIEAVFIHKDNKIMFVNSVGLKMMNTKNELEFLGKEMSKFIKYDQILVAAQNVLDASEEKCEHFVVKGELVCLAETAVSVEGKTTDIELLGERFTLTALKETTLKENIELEQSCYIELFDKTSNCVAIYKPNENKSDFLIKDYNSAAERLTNINRKEILDKSIFDAFPGLYGSEFYKALERVYKTGNPEKVPAIYYNDGTLSLWLESYLFRASSGEIVSIFWDAEQLISLNKKLKKFNVLFENTKDIILFVNTSGEIIETNNSAVKAYGYTREELITKSIKDLRVPHTAPLIEEQLKLAENGGTCFETVHKRKDGSKFHVEVSSVGANVGGDIVLCSIVRDVSERKKAEADLNRSKKQLNEAREYEKLRTEFFANLSHEFRTPLNVILTSQQLLNLYIENRDFTENNIEKISNNLKFMRLNCNRLIRLINNLLDLTKIDSGLLKLNLDYRNIVNIVEETTLSVAEVMKDKGINFLFDTDFEEKIIICDSEIIERMILSLLSNAIKFTNTGGKIEVRLYSNSEESICISIKDDGTGIPEDKLIMIFDKFTQADKSFTRNQEGSGIGLSLVKSLVELHKGNIKVESKEGMGSEFIIELPTKLLTVDGENIYSNSYYNNREGILEKINIEFSDIYSK